MGERYLKSIRLLAECMQGFERLSGEHVRQFGLTHAQFDIIATLGNTPGMAYKELGEKTLITKGTLTGVIDRLEQKGLVARARNSDDKRSYFVSLTGNGERVFADVFPKVTAEGGKVFAHFSDADYASLEQTLSGLKQLIAAGRSIPGASRAPRTSTDKKEKERY
ncbi:MarR family winged helix-turn-helix transcriptional regulator [Janthinobacterium fluminis]|uniref:MarR family transcriptional regulator n=1 Tax=Janthinobacterium fluminis TaxID=2987524 RepID=A0ABT5K6P4_9BURK|nr:MarR family transcriptional regulator [Janthinobacterium fluminis]MDC8759432.1 MarR family transcriptional regulator [Janthinobacterium fluminis]